MAWRADRLLKPLALLVVVACGSEPTGQGDGAGHVSGVLRDAVSGSPLSGAVIVVAGLNGTSGSDGRFHIDDVPSGLQPISAALAGFISVADSVSVPSGGTATITLTMTAGAAPPPPPTGVQAEVGSAPGSVRLAWQAVAGANAYNVYWSTTSGVDASTGEPLPNAANPLVHTGLSAGTTYFYVVTAVGADGESQPSAEVSAIPVGDISVQLLAPSGGDPVGVVLEIAARVTSVHQLAGVSGQVGAQSTSLAFNPATERWEGTLSLAGLPSPSAQQLSVTATDVEGTSAQVRRTLQFDRPPAVVLQSPGSGSVATPSTRVVATCQDDAPGGCTALTITAVTESHDRLVLITGAGNIDQTVSLAGLDGQLLQLEATGTDGAQQVTRVAHTVFVEASGHLTPVSSAGSGIVVDADATRLLVIDSVGAAHEVRLVDRASGASTILLTQPAPVVVQQAVLTPSGALFLTDESRGTLYEWRNGQVSTLTTGEYILDIHVKGNYAIWIVQHIPCCAVLMRRDLSAGTTLTVIDGVGNTANDVASDGDVVFWSNDYDVFVYHDGATTPLTSDGSVTWDYYPATDGTSVVYVKAAGINGPYSIRLTRAGNDIELASNTPNQPGPGTNYQVNEGWIAFTRPDLANNYQVWLRSPAGVEAQISSFGTWSLIEQLSPGGEVVFKSSATGAVRRYRGTGGQGPVDISSGLGRALYIDGQLHLLMGSTLFRVD